MKDFVATIATLAFMVATFCLMIHSAVLVCSGGEAVWLLAWLVPIGIASLVMALTNAPTPLWEKSHG